MSGVMQSRGWRLEEEGQAGPSPASVHSPLALSALRPDGLPRSLVSETKQSCLAHGAALGTELCAGGSCHFSHSSWRGSSGAGGFSCQVAHCLDSTGSPAGTVGLPTQESQRKCRAPWYRVICSICLRSRCEGPCRFKGRVHRPPLLGGVSRSVSDENVGSEKGWGLPVDGSLPADLTYAHVALCPCGWCWFLQSGGCAG